ncbi:MAG: sulfate ABC transporter permease subunit CysT [Sideroxydans sp.]|nr:sulfate ABC transporter permease subunit CysT [Sideroxydans sp.]
MSRFKAHTVLPGFNLALGFTVLYLSLIVLIPLSSLFFKTAELGFGGFWDVVTSDRVVASLRVTFVTSFIAAGINAFFGIIVAWVLIRYTFPGKRIIDALFDLPFALPTAVAGITLATIYASNGLIGQYFAAHDIKIAYTPIGIVVALTFIGLPFVVRTVQPVLADVEAEVEEAAASLGAGRWDVFRRIIFPAILPAVLAGFAMALARAVGEYGSVIFIAGNMPYISEIAPLLIVAKLEQYDYAGATAIAIAMLVISFALLLLINGLQWWSSRKGGR